MLSSVVDSVCIHLKRQISIKLYMFMKKNGLSVGPVSFAYKSVQFTMGSAYNGPCTLVSLVLEVSPGRHPNQIIDSW